jgi:hypothetical protein
MFGHAVRSGLTWRGNRVANKNELREKSSCVRCLLALRGASLRDGVNALVDGVLGAIVIGQ